MLRPQSAVEAGAERPESMTATRDERFEIETRINGRVVRASVPPRLLLSDWLRGQQRLTGTHVGCEHGVCGACTVLVDGEPARSCLLLAVQVDGCEVRTVEGLADGDRLHPLQEAFREKHGLQCGFCTPGILMTMISLLKRRPNPSAGEVREALGGHLCRCTGYQKIVESVLLAASKGATE